MVTNYSVQHRPKGRQIRKFHYVYHCNMGHYDVAEKDFFKAREIAKEIGDKNKEAESLSMAGWSMASGKKYEAVINIYHEAADFGRKIGNPISRAEIIAASD